MKSLHEPFHVHPPLIYEENKRNSINSKLVADPTQATYFIIALREI